MEVTGFLIYFQSGASKFIDGLNMGCGRRESQG